jgi:hypothetical protein
MARKPRFTLPGVPQHVIQRGQTRDWGEVFHCAQRITEAYFPMNGERLDPSDPDRVYCNAN